MATAVQIPSCLQIKVYSYQEIGSKPKTWDKSQKGSATFIHPEYDDKYLNFEMIKFINLSMETNMFVNSCIAEYVLVSLFLALMIEKHFIIILKKIETSLEYKSWY